MKLLNNEQQEDLRNLLDSLNSSDLELQSQIQFWRIELKPKRIRRVKVHDAGLGVDTVVDA